MRRFLTLACLAALAVILCPDLAAATSQNWQMGMQEAATPVAEHLHKFHNFLLVIITGIVIFVFSLLLFVMARFNSRANPTPSQTTHNVLLEIVWTVVPVIILITIAVPSFKLLYYMDRTENPEMTLKVTGYQWYWGYEYPDHGGVSFTSNMLPDADINAVKGQLRSLSVDNPLVLPVGTDIQVLVTAADVLHSFAVPSFGIKTDAVPGRTNETWIRIEKEGTYYGQCSELCGTNHAFMPIEVHAVSKEAFAEWVVAQGGTMPAAPTPVVLGGENPAEAKTE
ncbi:MAG: cytochrome c oxidase subunit II [Micavibrio aeruginosavorus]|nr:cytochrome c oxidase subunit II [Micavibrio aeruginosavorus]